MQNNKFTFKYSLNKGKLPCDGESCPYYKIVEGWAYCSYFGKIDGKWYLIGAMSCPIKMG